jgi:hypothetical protein
MDRILIARPATITITFTNEQDGAAVDPGVVDVVVTRADGSPLVSGAATGSGAAARSFALTAEHTALLDLLTVTWTSPQEGTLVSEVEVVGGLLFTIAEARATHGDQSLDAGKVAGARLYAETELENAIGYALVPRYARRTVSGVRGRPIELSAYARKVRAMTVGGVALSPDELALLTIDCGLLRGYPWPTGHSNVVIGFEHGLDTPTPGAIDAALALALDQLGGTGSIDPRAESIATVDGTIRLRTGGRFPTAGIDAWVDANRIPVIG